MWELRFSIYLWKMHILCCSIIIKGNMFYQMLILLECYLLTGRYHVWEAKRTVCSGRFGYCTDKHVCFRFFMFLCSVVYLFIFWFVFLLLVLENCEAALNSAHYDRLAELAFSFCCLVLFVSEFLCKQPFLWRVLQDFKLIINLSIIDIVATSLG